MTISCNPPLRRTVSALIMTVHISPANISVMAAH
jgi:hypothetical protein